MGSEVSRGGGAILVRLGCVRLTCLRPTERKFVPLTSGVTVPSEEVEVAPPPGASGLLAIAHNSGATPTSVSFFALPSARLPPLRGGSFQTLPRPRTWLRPGRRCRVSTTTAIRPLRSRPSLKRPRSSATRRCEGSNASRTSGGGTERAASTSLTATPRWAELQAAGGRLAGRSLKVSVVSGRPAVVPERTRAAGDESPRAQHGGAAFPGQRSARNRKWMRMRNCSGSYSERTCPVFPHSLVFGAASVHIGLLLRHIEERSGKLRLPGTSKQEVVFSRTSGLCRRSMTS